MDAVVLFYRMARLTCVPLPSSARDVEAAELDGLAAGALPDEPVVPDAAAEVQAEFLAAVLVDVPRARDEEGPSVQVLVEPVARGGKVEAQAELLAAVLVDVPRTRDEAVPSVRVLVEPVARDV
jgi:hypothetical protein